jgi:hypothetical protein
VKHVDEWEYEGNRDRLNITLPMRRWQEHLISATVTQAYRGCGDVNGVAPNMRWEDDDEAVKGLIMTSIPDEIFNRIKTGASAQVWWDSPKDICEGRSRSLLIDLGQNTAAGMTMMYALTSRNSLTFANSSQLWVRAPSQTSSMLIS